MWGFVRKKITWNQLFIRRKEFTNLYVISLFGFYELKIISVKFNKNRKIVDAALANKFLQN